jgi:sorting nexin-4
MERDDFSNVSWQNDPAGRGAGSSVASPRGEGEGAGPGANGKRQGSTGQIGRSADAMDLAGVGDGVLECTVTSPIKENDGTKDAYVSYLVTTNVCLP